MSHVADNLARVEERIARVCRRCGRPRDAVTLVCVSKRIPGEQIEAAHRAGARIFGESYGQELRDKHRQLGGLPGLRWHFIGPLQRNKVKYVVGTSALIHAVHSAEIIAAIERRAVAQGVDQDVLVQLNLAQEPTKSGILAHQLDALLDHFADCQRVRCVGLMTMPPFHEDPERSRPLFAALRELRQRAAGTPRANVTLSQLSMGMSHDFGVAIEEGATLVRVGTAIFGPREPA